MYTKKILPIMEYVPRYEFNKCVQKYNGGY